MIAYVIGCKSDLEEQREVPKSEAKEYCEKHGIRMYMETSSLSGQNIDSVFSLAAKDIFYRQSAQEKEDEEEANDGKVSPAASPVKVKLGEKREKKKEKSGCC